MKVELFQYVESLGTIESTPKGVLFDGAKPDAMKNMFAHTAGGTPEEKLQWMLDHYTGILRAIDIT